ncbi:hypothetical protein [Kribbella sp. NBC_00359]|jgi:hypothetical protein|uniref:hypothetical protein n=1 Tax=Kribbella sp. NBC_00359 TaxID=2975966 RepID=UPI002E214FA3
MTQTVVDVTTGRAATGGLRDTRPLVITIIGPVRVHRENLATALGQIAGIDVIGTAPTFPGTTSRDPVNPDIILVDVSGECGTQLIPALPASRPGARLVALGTPEDDESIIACVAAGVAGFRRPGGNASRHRHDSASRRPGRLGLPAEGHRRHASPDRVLRPIAA